MKRAVTSLLVLLVAGCGHRQRAAPADGPGMNRQREASLRAGAEEELGCPRELLTVRFVSSPRSDVHVYQVDGCGRSTQESLHCAGGVCSWLEVPERRAANDLQCPREQLTRQQLSASSFALSGCGRSITYHFVGGRLAVDTRGDLTGAPPPPPATP